MGKQKQREFFTCRPILKEILKQFLGQKEKDSRRKHRDIGRNEG